MMDSTGVPFPEVRHSTPSKRRRIWELDFLRGFFILLMVMDHTFFDLNFLFDDAWRASGLEGAAAVIDFANFYWYHPIRLWVHDMVLWGFFLLCGMSVTFSRNPWLHSAKISLCAIALTYGTKIAASWGLGNIVIRFGVLHMLGLSSLLAALVWTATKRSRTLTVGVFGGLAFLFYTLNLFWLQRADFTGSPVWMCLFSERMGAPGLFSPGDYFPLFGSLADITKQYPAFAVPYISRVLMGSALVPLLYPRRRTLLPTLDRAWHRPMCFLGRNTIWVVLLHQVLIPVILGLISYIWITPGSFGF
ncbi:MAG: DUF1624 domain-containing protein [Clostridia bacterium]|nr:DUF1624 domain-containing protein [Clostridia bacterium]